VIKRKSFTDFLCLFACQFDLFGFGGRDQLVEDQGKKLVHGSAGGIRVMVAGTF